MGALAGKLNPQNRPLAPQHEPHCVKLRLDWKMHAGSISKVALPAQGLVIAARLRRVNTAVARKAVSQREPMPMRPELPFVGFSRNEIRTSQSSSPSRKAILPIRSAVVCFAYVR